MARLRPKKILLVGWDGADWTLIDPLLDAGKLPNLERLVNQGVVGNLATLTPAISPILWTSIATGKRPFKHGVLGFTEPDTRHGGIRPITNLSRKTKAIWNILSQEGKSNVVVGWWPSHPAEPIKGVMVSNHYQQAVAPYGHPWPFRPGTVHPPRLARNLEQLRVHPQDLDLGLIELFLPRLAEIDQAKDRRVETLAKSIAECATINSVATAILHHEPWDFAAVYFDGIDHLCHGFMSYHPPKLSTVTQDDFEKYRIVVDGGYRYHDWLLGKLLQETDEDTLVILISDHGFKSRDLRPTSLPTEPAGPTVQHRHHGILVMAGPGVKADERIYGANLLDICPTILVALGLPVGKDMDGVPLVNAFSRPPKILSIDSWDAVDGRAGQHPPDMQIDSIEAREAVQQLVDLGYIDPPNEDREKAAEESVRELDYNLARVYMDAGRHAEALSILQKLADAWPHEHRFGIQLITCYQALDRVKDGRRALERLLERKEDDAARARTELEGLSQQHKDLQPDQWPDEDRRRFRDMAARASANPFAIHYLTGSLLMTEGDEAGALEQLEKARTIDPRQPGMHVKLGDVYLRLKRWKEAHSCFERALDLDPDNAAAFLGRCRSLLPLRRNREATGAALDSIGLIYYNPVAHFLLGVALHRLGRLEQALQALEVAVAQNPNLPEAHRRMAHIHAKRLNDPNRAAHHRRLASEASQRLRVIRLNRNAESDPAPRHPMASDQTPAVPEIGANGSPEGLPPKTGGRVDMGRTVVVVSGLPRSGTSMVMQMLLAGGMPLLIDGKRPADEDNPRGYFEYAPVKRLLQDNTWLDQAAGKAVKIIAPLLEGLQPGIDYRILFLERDLDEVIRSQRCMLRHQGLSGADLSNERLEALFAKQVKTIKSMLARLNMATLFLSYREFVKDAQAAAGHINAFLGGWLNESAMATAVDPALYRQHRPRYAYPKRP